MCEFSLNNFILQECKRPTYLKQVDRLNDNTIILAFKKPRNDVEVIILDETVDISTKLENTSLNHAELTGNPLEIDLNSAENSINVTLIEKKPNSWLKSEGFHNPMSLEYATRIVNLYNIKGVAEFGDNLGHRIYCVCDGMNATKTLLIGAATTETSFYTYEMYFKGCFIGNDPQISLNSLINEHKDDVNADVKLDCEIISSYILQGCDLKLLENVDAAHQYGALLMDVSWKDCSQFKFETGIISNVKLQIQSIAGHRNSPLFPIWEDILLVQKYLRLFNLNGNELDECPLSDIYLSSRDIGYKIDEILQQTMAITNMVLKNQKIHITNFEKFRNYNTTDHFWNILKCCGNLDDVRLTLNYIFTEFAQNKLLNIDIPSNPNTFIELVLNGIRKGTDAVPTLTPIKALECLVELGITKLKKDYLFILNTYNCDTQHAALEIFDIPNTEPYARSTINQRRTSRFYKDDQLNVNRNRKSVFTLQHAKVDTSLYEKQMRILSGLHMSVQSINLAKEKLSENSDNFQNIPQMIMDYFLGPDWSITGFEDLQKKKLCEIFVDINSMDKDVLLKQQLLYWNYRFKSIDYKTTSTSIYHLSLDPIFPPSIFKDYDIPDTKECMYYVTHLLAIEDTF